MGGSRIPLHKRLSLELHHVVQKQRIDEHFLHQLFWECTLRCNLNCRHCGSDCRMVSEQSDMPLGDFLKVLDEIRSQTDPSDIMVITTGGEPLLRSDLSECGRQIISRGFVWGMVSNGMLLDEEKLKELIDSGLKSIAISFDGFEADHNWMRGHPESYRRAENAIKALTKTSGLVWDVISCVNQRTIQYLPEFRDYLIGLGVPKWRLFTVFPFGRAANEPELKLSDGQFIEMMDFIRQTRLENKINTSYGCDGFLGVYEGEVRNRYFACSAGVNVASVLADGSISGCLSIRSDYHQGNIYHDSFWEVWQNRFLPYRDHRWMRTGKCARCKVWRYCQGNGMHLRDGEGKLHLCQYEMITRALKDKSQPLW